MAWRDSRRNRSRLALFISSIILGIAALVATFSFSYNLQRDVNDQAKTMVGADLVVEASGAVSPQIQPLLDSIGRDRSKERSFASMIYFVRSKATRLIQVRALEGNYPYYGSLETTPAAAARTFRTGRYALVDKTLMLQYGAKVGDSVRIGTLGFAISGTLNKAPGRNEISLTVAPPVYIPLRYLAESGLLQKGSRVSTLYYYKMDSLSSAEQVLTAIEPRLQKAGLEYETVETRKKRTGRSFDDFSQFLTLIGFIALLLGSIGVASAIHIYIREKIGPIAILRCLGVKAWQAFVIYLIQILGIGLVGSVAGAALGTLIQQLLPLVLKDFLPFQATVSLSWKAVFQGVLLGLTISMLFALLPLVSVRKISPLNTLRLSYEATSMLGDPLKWLLYLLLLTSILAFSGWQMHSLTKALVFTGSVLLALGLLAAAARTMMWLTRKFFPFSWNYLLRQGFANLYRPNNQTVVLIITIGLGVAFIGTLYFVQDMLISRLSVTASGNQANMILFDIQSSQVDGLAGLTQKSGLPVLQKVPIVTMRIEEINGKKASYGQREKGDSVPNRAFESELRVTYRDSLSATEKIISGRLHGPVRSPADTVFISMEEGYARRLHVKTGDRIVFNVQGLLLPTVIGSLRQVSWRQVGTNFRVTFPGGVLESAPQFYVLITRVGSSEESARFQQSVIARFPNVSIIDMRLVLSVLDDILSKIGFVIRFMAGFSIVTGLVVLIASVLISKYQRMQESVLLRTLGASRRQILAINALEYFFLGSLAAATGLLLAIGASWALAKYSFDSPLSVSVIPVIILFLSIVLVTMTIGLLNSREVLSQTPLEILRKEV